MTGKKVRFQNLQPVEKLASIAWAPPLIRAASAGIFAVDPA
jgi:hypothetical protein